jgi:hypothetical protein
MNTLELKSDGDYVHGYQENGSAKETLTGKWELERTRYGQVVRLDNFHALPGENTQGQWILSPGTNSIPWLGPLGTKRRFKRIL